MPIKPTRRPVVSRETGRPSDERAPGAVGPGQAPARRSAAAAAGDRRAAETGRPAHDERRPVRGGPRPEGRAPAAPRGPAGESRHGPSAGTGRAGPRPDHRPHAASPVLAADRPAGLYLSCAAGVEPLLAAEAQRILGPGLLVTESRGGIDIHPAGQSARAEDTRAALIDAAMRLNLESRLAQRVLWRVASRVYRHEDDIYVLGRAVNWSDWITPRHTLRVDVTSRRSTLRSLNFAALRIKDAVCDDLRERFGERPDVDTRHPDLSLVLYMDDLEATLYVDTSGEALFKRGWREDTGEAPLKETLAAAMLAAAGWQGRPEDGALLDPCCGAGTIPIEAAQIACDIAPGLQRRFAFERLLPFRAHLGAWQALKQAARARQHEPRVPIYAGDVSFRMTDFATRNAERAGVRHAIEFKTADALQRPVPCERGVLMFNPPYGERIDTKGSVRDAYQARQAGDRDGPSSPGVRAGREQFEGDEEAATFFQRLSSHWKKHYTGWTAWILSPDMKLPGAMRLKESRRVVLFNGPIECRLFRFDLVAGSLKPRGPSPDASPAEPPSDGA
ncbi:THUMP domain-containing protein [uncultured Aquabacterium sp.]|uniref:THUMP domain-containing class I SAM-dependent RNA methyltransferase n=1 Tax=Aquabacterium sp. TaxID=1872578 RepID=UPI00345A6AF0